MESTLQKQTFVAAKTTPKSYHTFGFSLDSPRPFMRMAIDPEGRLALDGLLTGSKAWPRPTKQNSSPSCSASRLWVLASRK